MPKRDDYEHLSKKLRRLERKIRRKTRQLSSSSSESTPHRLEEEEDCLPVEENFPVTDIEQPIEILEFSMQQTATIEDSSAASEPTEPLELDLDIMEILGNDPTTNTKYGKDINADLAIRLQHYTTSGMTKEVRKELSDKYLIPDNCRLIDAPQLNAEIKAALTEVVSKRDKYIENRQKQLAITVACLSEALSHLISDKNKDTYLIRLLMDANRNLCDCQYSDSITRRNFILSTLNKGMKEQLQITKLTNFLFGDNLSETIKVAKAINRSGAELKATLPALKQGQNKKPLPGSSKNWKTPFPTKKPPRTGIQKTRQSAPPAKGRQSSSYKQSQPRQSNSRR